MEFKPISESSYGSTRSSTDSTRNSTPIPISRGASTEVLDLDLDSFRSFTPVDRENMIKEANVKNLLENVILNMENDKTDRFAGYLEYYRKHIQDKEHEIRYLLDIYRDIDTQYQEFLKTPFVDNKQAYQDYVKAGMQELIVFIELLKTKNSIENASHLLHARGEVKTHSPFNKTSDYNRLENEFLNMRIGGKTRAKKLSVKNKTSKKKANTFFFNPSNPNTNLDVYVYKAIQDVLNYTLPKSNTKTGCKKNKTKKYNKKKNKKTKRKIKL